MTGAGKSVIVADLLAQTGHRFGFRLIVEEGLSHAVLTQTQGCEPVIINPNANLTINYLDTCEAPLSPLHLALSAGLCMLFWGNEGLDGERKAIPCVSRDVGFWVSIISHDMGAALAISIDSSATVGLR